MNRGRVEDTGMTSVRPRTVSRFSWPPAMRLVVSLALVAYLAAVIVPPLAGPPPASDLAMAALQPLRPLVGALFLGHGYRFFAPNPGPGDLPCACQITSPLQFPQPLCHPIERAPLVTSHQALSLPMKGFQFLWAGSLPSPPTLEVKQQERIRGHLHRTKRPHAGLAGEDLRKSVQD
jgi:hypothetical protein